LTDSINSAVELITRGRLGLRTEGKAEQGRIDFHDGLKLAHELYTQAFNENDLFCMLLCENTFLTKDLEGAEPDEQDAIKSYETALVEYDDAFNCLDLVENPDEYKKAAVIISHNKKCRYHGMPKDGFIVAMAGQPARIKNGMTAVGTDPDERALRKYRIKVCKKALDVYFKKQEVIFGTEGEQEADE
jgi:hypothetical protein